jgi:hypothetical protein
LFADGVKLALVVAADGDTSSITPSSWSSPGDLFLGCRNDVGGAGAELFTDGQLADYIRYSRSLTDNEILSLSKGEKPAMFANLETLILHMGQMRDETGNIEPSNAGSSDSSLGPPVPGGN